MNRPSRPKLMLVGANGQLGWELNRSLLPNGDVFAFHSNSLDLLDTDTVRRKIRELKPDVIVNAAAYTAVDKAEEDREMCMKLNARVPALLAEEAEKQGAWLVHYSSDYIFNGKKEEAWKETDTPDPINFYGESKLAGEENVRERASKFLIFRTSWVYASRGRNFLLTMLQLFEKNKSIRVVQDQIGAPTWARYIADVTTLAIRRGMEDGGNIAGVYHLASSGQVSWYGFAEFIKNESTRILGKFRDVLLQPVATAEYPLRASRPLWSVLDTSKIERVLEAYPSDWQVSAHLCLAEVFGRMCIDE